MKKLKVAWISDFPVEWLPDIPGPLRRLPRLHSLSWQRVLLEEFERDPSLDLHVFAVRRRLGQDCHFERNGVSFHVVNVNLPRAHTLYWPDTWALRPQLQNLQPDVVHAWGTERGSALVAQRTGFPHLVTVQGLMTWYAERLSDFNFHEKLSTRLERKCLPRAPLVTTESNFAVTFLKERFPSIRIHQAEHAPNWLFHRLKRMPQGKPLRFVFTGAVCHRKGSDMLFAALQRLAKEVAFELVLMGWVDPRFQKSFDRVMQSPLSKHIVLKRASASEVAEELARATMMLFPTRADTSPNAVKEAAVAGVPVVASAVGGIPDYVFPNRNGFLFPSDNLEEFVKAIRQAVAHPMFRQGQVETETLQQVREYLSPPLMAKRFREAYELVLREK